MDRSKKIEILESLVEKVEVYNSILHSESSTNEERKRLKDEITELYGAIEPYYREVVSIQKIEVPVAGAGSRLKDIYPNFFEAGYFSGRTYHMYQGGMELRKVLARIKNEDNSQSKEIDNLVAVTKRFRACCNYIDYEIKNEKDVQDILWIMLRANYAEVEREETLKRFGVKQYRPDFGIPELKTLIEVKFIGDKTDPKKIQEEILSDIEGYLNKNQEYIKLIVFIYDQAQKLKDPEKLIQDINKIELVQEVVVIPGI